MFNKILIANRGEIACRIIRTARRLGISCVAIYSEVDEHAQHVKQADEAYFVGKGASSESYLNQNKILSIAKEAKVQAIHPGYGFLSENADFAAACLRKGIAFIGPPVEAVVAMGSKSAAKAIMNAIGVPVIPGFYGKNQQPEFLAQQANKIGYPILIKAVAGGGGKGMRVVLSAKDFAENLAGAKREALKSFGSDEVLLEKYLASPRHIEIQIFADQHGHMVHLFERDCSIQRRHQKIIEESPAVNFSEKLRKEMTACAILAARTVKYVGAGTVEFLLAKDQFYFMEMNTRLQVEHAVTEKITGIDLVEWQLRVAAGEPLPLTQAQISLSGHAVEARVYAEDPHKQFLPSVGSIYFLSTPTEDDHIRLDSGIVEGDVITTYYDPMLSKLIVYGENRSDALRYLQKGLADYQLVGVTTNRDFLQKIIEQPDFIAGKFTTHFIDTHLTALLNETLISDAQKTHDPYSPWTFCDAWRLNGTAEQTLRFLCGEQVVTTNAMNSNHKPDGKAYLTAPLPGTVIALLAKEGDKVEIGSSLAIIETMKMEHTIRAPSTGIVKSWYFRVGDLVNEGEELLAFEKEIFKT